MKEFLRSIVTVIAITTLIAAGYWIGANKDDFLTSRVGSVSDVAGPTHIYPHDAYLDAIELEESGGNALAMGDYDKWANCYRAVGAYQLWKIYIDDFNRIQKANRAWHQATYEDRWDPVKSRKITSVVTAHYANYDWQDKPHTQLQWIETAVRAHKCPTDRNKPSTKAYWLEVKARMESE